MEFRFQAALWPEVTDEVSPVEFPDDLTGHFWARREYDVTRERWTFEILDYQNNVLLSGVAVTEAQAASFVLAWDAVVVTSRDDPSMDWQD